MTIGAGLFFIIATRRGPSLSPYSGKVHSSITRIGGRSSGAFEGNFLSTSTTFRRDGLCTVRHRG